MLIKDVVLDRIQSGDIDTLFRRQKRPTVKTGGTLRTRIGLLDIVKIEQIDLAKISARDAKRAGYDGVDELVADLTQKPDGEFYRVRVRLGGVDPRVALRERARLSAADARDVRERLARFDQRSMRGPWTHRFLSMIAEQPHVRAPDLAASIGWETKPFKDHVRKLKGLGLTISHSPGYELSPRGHAVLAML